MVAMAIGLVVLVAGGLRAQDASLASASEAAPTPDAQPASPLLVPTPASLVVAAVEQPMSTPAAPVLQPAVKSSAPEQPVEMLGSELLELSPLLEGPARELVTQAVTSPALEHARVGLYAFSLTTGAVLLRKNGRLLLNPASNAKLVTSAVVLVRLGPEFTFTTDYASTGELVDGVLQGNIYVRGRGDPTITTERLLSVVHALKLQGIKRIDGRIVVDDSLFDGVREAKGWEQEDSDRAYAAPVGALSLNFNTVNVWLRPGPAPGSPATVTVDPPSDYIKVDSRVSTDLYRGRVYMRSYQKGDKNVVRLRGRIRLDAEPQKLYRRVADPALHFGSALAGILRDAGVRVRHGVRRGLMPDRARNLVVDRSPRLTDIVAQLNKWSNNFIAEMLIKKLGAEVYGAPGSFAKGLDVAQAFLESEVGWRRGAYVFENGSGLNDVNRFSTEQIARLLAYMHWHPEAGAEYVASLGVAGRQGTIAWRLRHTAADRRLRAKTGTLTGVSALSGYVTTSSGEPVVFSILVNGYDGSTRPIWEVQDMIGEALALYGSARPRNLDQASLNRSDL